jgi:hypothetical protein
VSAITVKKTYNNANLPSDQHYDDAIMAHPAFRMWLRAETDPVNVDVTDGLITKWRDVKEGNVVATQVTAANQAALTPNVIGGYGAATFDGFRRYGFENDPVDFTQPYTLVAVCRSAGHNNYHGVCGKWDSTTIMAGALLYSPATNGAGNIEFRHGGNGRPSAYVAGTWDVFIASVNPGLLQMQIRHQGVDSIVGAAGTNLPVTSAFGIGAVNATGSFGGRGDISDIILFQTDALLSDRALVRLIELQILGAYPTVFDFAPQAAV